MLYLYNIYFNQIQLIKPKSSNPNSKEFYIVGIGFKGITQSSIDKLLLFNKNFKVNDCFFKKSEISQIFVKQAISFIEDIFNLSINQKQIKIILINCLHSKDSFIKKKFQCEKYVDDTFIKKIQTKRYKEWIKTYRFEQIVCFF